MQRQAQGEHWIVNPEETRRGRVRFAAAAPFTMTLELTATLALIASHVVLTAIGFWIGWTGYRMACSVLEKRNQSSPFTLAEEGDWTPERLTREELEEKYPTLLIRCSRHIAAPQLNRNEHSGGECGACIDARRKRLVDALEGYASDVAFGSPVNNQSVADAIRKIITAAETTLAETEEGEWIPWYKSECPVHEWAMVDVKFRDGGEVKGRRAQLWLWGYPNTSNQPSDITHYRPSK